ncbi:MAG: hypothetical protein AMJ90_03055 [candidate division Zixibacteria bacterium SM23_73_2]|nr:MAG: hypothetical protein AMJ90_03055 [candidate division Zixibacteria bacterium SM23_73_2]
MITKKVYRLNFASYLVSFLPEILFVILFAYLLVSVLGASKNSYLNLTIAVIISFFIYIFKLFFVRLQLDDDALKIRGSGERNLKIKWEEISKVKARKVTGILRLFKSSSLEIHTRDNQEFKIKDVDCYYDYPEILTQLRIKLGNKLEITK